MKRISFLLLVLTLCAAPALRAQDAATEERLNKLSGKIEDLIAAQELLKKQMAEFSREVASLREQAGKPNPGYASQEDLKRLADGVREVDRKRLEDYDRIHAEIVKLGGILQSTSAAAKTPKPPSRAPKDSEPATPEKSAKPETGYEYVIQKGDTLSVIVQAYKDKNIKVTTDQIVKANPGLKPEKLRVGQKIFIPAPQS